MNLSTIPDIASRFDVISGLSDHTLGTTVSLTSVGLGASIIEKHFTLLRADGGPDAAFSLEPLEMKGLVTAIKDAEIAIGTPHYIIDSKEAENKIFKRSLFVINDIKKGEKFTRENVRCIRPGYGLEPKYLADVMGKIATINIERGTPLDWNLISK